MMHIEVVNEAAKSAATITLSINAAKANEREADLTASPHDLSKKYTMRGMWYVFLCQCRQGSACTCLQMKGPTTNNTAQNIVTFVAAPPKKHEEGTTPTDKAFFLDQLASQLYQ